MRAASSAPTLGRTWKPAALPVAVWTTRFSMADGLPIERSAMKWETPQALDHRFGFEITMYISTR
jgi:coenzyme PQQ precursor peptide PqqA